MIRASSRSNQTTSSRRVENGVPVEYVVFPDEGHGFAKEKNQIEGYRAVLKFLDQHLIGK